ncbi:hypothetical protein A4R35_00205 [Thermogemmatispora tikiterensis]|uniref:Uncharacterized protein n=1 Tax=Thermogemmatispora tikiterensis TaxID=1825093 RepID=A0A328VDA8_9CHLR|nr:hypothetical protein A4R35_00205 [Thermogemmatispora tikiterensis]
MEQLPEPAQDLHLEAELAADAGEPVEQAASGRPGGLDDIAEFEQFDPAAGAGDAHQLADNTGPGLGRNGGHQQPLMGITKLAVGKGQALQHVRPDEDAGGGHRLGQGLQGDVDAHHEGVRKEGLQLEGPDAGAGAYVQDGTD